MSAPPPDVARVVALAGRLRIAPRALLVVLARLSVRRDGPLTDEHVRRELDLVAAAPGGAAAAAALALLGPGAYALDDIGQALEMAWSAHVRLP